MQAVSSIPTDDGGKALPTSLLSPPTPSSLALQRNEFNASGHLHVNYREYVVIPQQLTLSLCFRDEGLPDVPDREHGRGLHIVPVLLSVGVHSETRGGGRGITVTRVVVRNSVR